MFSLLTTINLLLPHPVYSCGKDECITLQESVLVRELTQCSSNDLMIIIKFSKQICLLGENSLNHKAEEQPMCA